MSYFFFLAKKILIENKEPMTSMELWKECLKYDRIGYKNFQRQLKHLHYYSGTGIVREVQKYNKGWRYLYKIQDKYKNKSNNNIEHEKPNPDSSREASRSEA